MSDPTAAARRVSFKELQGIDASLAEAPVWLHAVRLPPKVTPAQAVDLLRFEPNRGHFACNTTEVHVLLVYWTVQHGVIRCRDGGGK
jgi:hypothetical protein